MSRAKFWAGTKIAVLPARNARIFAFATPLKFLAILGCCYFLGLRAIVSVVYVTTIDLGLKPLAELDE